MSRYPHFPPNTPSVTEVLKDCGLIDTTGFNPYSADRGSKAHRACQYLDEGCLDRDSVDHSIAGYLAAYEKFKEESGMVFDLIEAPVYEKSLEYCGTLDRANTGKKIVLDLKTGVPQKWHGAQLAAYSIPIFTSQAVVKRYGLYLKQDGTYSLKEYKDRRDYTIWSAALVIYRAKRSV